MHDDIDDLDPTDPINARPWNGFWSWRINQSANVE